MKGIVRPVAMDSRLFEQATLLSRMGRPMFGGFMPHLAMAAGGGMAGGPVGFAALGLPSHLHHSPGAVAAAAAAAYHHPASVGLHHVPSHHHSISMAGHHHPAAAAAAMALSAAAAAAAAAAASVRPFTVDRILGAHVPMSMHHHPVTVSVSHVSGGGGGSHKPHHRTPAAAAVATSTADVNASDAVKQPASPSNSDRDLKSGKLYIFPLSSHDCVY